MEDRGAEGPSFPPIVAAAAHGALPHAVPRDVEIPRDTLVVIDMGATVDGYCSDCTRTLATGLARRERARGLRARAGGPAEALGRHERPGRECRDGGRRRARDHRRGRPRGALRPRAWATASGSRSTRRRASRRRRRARWSAGNAVTVEPGVYVPGRVRRPDRGPRDRDRRRARGPHRVPEGTRHSRLMIAGRGRGVRGAVRAVGHRASGSRSCCSPALFAVMEPDGGGDGRCSSLGAALNLLVLFERPTRAGCTARRRLILPARYPGSRSGRGARRASRRSALQIGVGVAVIAAAALAAAPPRAAAARVPRCRGGLPQRRAHHVDQRERAAARAVARADARCARPSSAPRSPRRSSILNVAGSAVIGVAGRAPTWSIQDGSSRSWPAFSWATGSARWRFRRLDQSASTVIVSMMVICTGRRAWWPESSRSHRANAELAYGSTRIKDGHARRRRTARLAGSCRTGVRRASQTVTAASAVARACFRTSRRPRRAGRLLRAKAPARGLVSVRLRSAGDWDSASSAGTGRLVAGSASFGGQRARRRASCAGASGSSCRRAASAATRRERAGVDSTSPASRRRRGAASRWWTWPRPTRADKEPAPDARPRRDRARRRELGRRRAPRPRRRAQAARGGLPLPRAGRRPRRAGSPQRRGATCATRAAAAASGLPSGRTAYRRLPDYDLEMKQLAMQYPSLVRPITLNHRSIARSRRERHRDHDATRRTRATASRSS